MIHINFETCANMYVLMNQAKHSMKFEYLSMKKKKTGRFEYTGEELASPGYFLLFHHTARRCYHQYHHHPHPR